MAADGGFAMRPLCGVTLREIAHISAGGAQIRVRFTNEFGADPLTIRDAHVALSASGSKIQPGTDHALTFGGASAVRIPEGAVMYSDPVDLKVAPLSDLAVSFFLPSQVMRSETFHSSAQRDNFIAQGDVAQATDLAEPTVTTSWYFFDGIDVTAEDGSRAVVALGDSITDGAHSTHNANHRWPNYLAARLQDDPALQHISVLNVGIGGNRILNDGYGPNALSRLDRDLLAQNGVKYVIVLEGINDIGRLKQLSSLNDEVTAEQLEQGLKQIADVAHQHGIKAFGATITPYQGAGYYTERGEQIREAVNQWIRNSGTFDGVVDFDKATLDPLHPLAFDPRYDSGDHLHPNDAGYRSMADAVNLALFQR